MFSYRATDFFIIKVKFNVGKICFLLDSKARITQDYIFCRIINLLESKNLDFIN